MKKFFTIFIIALSFAANSNAEIPPIVTTPGACNSESVMINGVCWAKTNLGASSPTDYGNYYTWEEAKKACPAGWRLPTKKEIESLINSGSVWTTRNGVSGRLFGKAPNQIFLPTAGFHNSSKKVVYAGDTGYYWSSPQSNNGYEYYLYFLSGGASTSYDRRIHYGFSVRPVAK
ncbi:MAG: hypothetical protein LBN95_09545 [Prevotellaceae bacterium]|jgi:uncharacterized protein (TIGR02145 family)|nr:hypothetical protein [Prevotellaceae bacterium]